MKKLALTLSAFVICASTTSLASIAEDFQPNISRIIPITCPVNNNCTNEQQKCEETTPVFNSCDEIQQWKMQYCERRAKIYDQLCLTQEQRVKASTIDNKFFDEIAPIKLCLKQEEAKYEEMKCKKCKFSAKRAQKAKIKDLKNEIKDKEKAHKECFMQILNCSQKETYKKLMKECKKHKKPKCECGCK